MSIDKIRNEIDKIDDEIVNLFLQRMECSKKIGELKKSNMMDILDSFREHEILNRVMKSTDAYKDEVKDLFLTILKLSKDVQKR